MAQRTSLYSTILEESEQLIHLLEQYAADSALAREALTRHQQIHQELQTQQHRSEEALAQWRAALTRRWRCEVEGQRQYIQIVQKLRTFYGSTSAQVQAVLPSEHYQPGTAPNLLNDMRRMHATLQLMQPPLPDVRAVVDGLEQACSELDVALTETERCDRLRRMANIERRMTSDACQRASIDTRRTLQEHIGVAGQRETIAYHGHHIPVELFEYVD